MRTLYIVRHAKSSWDNFNLSDEERPLNDKGRQDAPEMAKKLKKKDVEIDVFISSPAKRARKTCKYFRKEFGVKKKDVVINDALYPGGVEDIYSIVSTVDDKNKSAAIFGHNPAVTDFVNTLTEHKVDDMPTCSIFAVKADIKSWKEFRNAKKELLLFDFPNKPQ